MRSVFLLFPICCALLCSTAAAQIAVPPGMPGMPPPPITITPTFNPAPSLPYCGIPSDCLSTVFDLVGEDPREILDPRVEIQIGRDEDRALFAMTRNQMVLNLPTNGNTYSYNPTTGQSYFSLNNGHLTAFGSAAAGWDITGTGNCGMIQSATAHIGPDGTRVGVGGQIAAGGMTAPFSVCFIEPMSGGNYCETKVELPNGGHVQCSFGSGSIAGSCKLVKPAAGACPGFTASVGFSEGATSWNASISQVILSGANGMTGTFGAGAGTTVNGQISPTCRFDLAIPRCNAALGVSCQQGGTTFQCTLGKP